LRQSFALVGFGAAIGLGFGDNVQAETEVAGVRFEDSLRLGDRDLRLNGAGVRSVAFVKLYAAALYVPVRSTSAAELLAQTGPRRLAMRMLMDLGAERLVTALSDGLERNHDAARLAALRPRIERLQATMRSIGEVRRGDLVTIDLQDTITRIAVNGRPLPETIAGEDFYAAILRVFLGERPADSDLKRGLLG
jgi:hypothetical protein